MTAHEPVLQRHLATGASTSIGFNGAWTGSNPKPTAFTLNGVACNGGTTPPTTPPPTDAPAHRPACRPTAPTARPPAARRARHQGRQPVRRAPRCT